MEREDERKGEKSDYRAERYKNISCFISQSKREFKSIQSKYVRFQSCGFQNTPQKSSVPGPKYPSFPFTVQ